ncbi:MAG: hypothetical protein ACSHX7_08370 [Luteolibacter sp.]
MKILRLVLLSLFALALHGFSQETDDEDDGTTDTSGSPRFWEATLDGGSFIVALDRIASISRHEYLISNASVIVDEVIVDTLGAAVTRFYYIRPITDEAPSGAVQSLPDRAREILDNSARQKGVTLQDMVTKEYPTTTHAKTIEFRIQTEEQLGALFESAKKAWQSNKGRKFSTGG